MNKRDYKSIKVGILGAGHIAEKMSHTLNILEGWEAYAIASRSQEKADRFAEKFHFQKAYGSYEALIEDENVDLIYVATPHSHHWAPTRLALQNRKPCLVEKAFTANAREAKELIDLSREMNVFVAEAIWTRYQPMRQIISEMLESDVIGKVKLVTCSLGYPIEQKERIQRPELCGGALLDLGVYGINFVRMFFPGKWESITSQCTKSQTGMDMTECISVRYEDGLMANMQFSAVCVNDRYGLISGEKGYMVVDNINNPSRATAYDKFGNVLMQRECPQQITGFEYELEACREALQKGWIESPCMPHEEILQIMRIMDELRREWGVVFPMD